MQIRTWRIVAIKPSPEILYKVSARPVSGEIDVADIAIRSDDVKRPAPGRGKFELVDPSSLTLGEVAERLLRLGWLRSDGVILESCQRLPGEAQSTLALFPLLNKHCPSPSASVLIRDAESIPQPEERQWMRSCVAAIAATMFLSTGAHAQPTLPGLTAGPTPAQLKLFREVGVDPLCIDTRAAKGIDEFSFAKATRETLNQRDTYPAEAASWIQSMKVSKVSRSTMREVLCGSIAIGMRGELVMLAMGTPLRKVTEETADGVFEVREFEGGVTVSLRNGRVVAIRKAD